MPQVVALVSPTPAATEIRARSGQRHQARIGIASSSKNAFTDRNGPTGQIRPARNIATSGIAAIVPIVASLRLHSKFPSAG